MTGAVRMSLPVTGKPAPASAPAIDARVREVVLVTRASGTAAAQLVQRRDRPGQRFPRDGQHAVDVDQHRVNAPHAPTITAAAPARHRVTRRRHYPRQMSTSAQGCMSAFFPLVVG